MVCPPQRETRRKWKNDRHLRHLRSWRRGSDEGLADHRVYHWVAQPQTSSIRSGSSCLLGQRTRASTGTYPAASSIYSEPMIDTFIDGCETLVSVVSGRGKNPTSRISRVGMPNGFF